MSIPNRIRNRGAILVFALIAVLLVSVSMIPVAQYVRQTARLAFSTRGSDQAFYAAEAGVARTLSYIFAVGTGAVTGIHDEQFNVTESNPAYPFGDDWINMEPGLEIDNDAKLAVKVRVFFDPVESGWVIESIGRSLVPTPNYRTVRVTIGAGTFARYAFFNSASLSSMDGRPRWLAANERFLGPVHSNRHLFVYGFNSPNQPLTFESDVTIVGSEVRHSNPNNQNVVYNGLKDTSADYVELPSDLTVLKNAAADGGLVLPAHDPWLESPPAGWPPTNPIPVNNYRFDFNEDGTLTYTNLNAALFLQDQHGLSESAALANASTTVDLGELNGALVVEAGNAFVKGIVNGRVTLAALANNPNLIPYNANVRSDGNVIVEDSIIYNTHPKLEDGSYDLSDDRVFDPEEVTDVMGLIAERNFLLNSSAPTTTIIDAHIMVTGQASPNPDVRDWNPTTSTNVTIGPAINQDGAFYVEDGVQLNLSQLWTGIPDSPGSWKNGEIYLTGGVVHFIRGQTANSTAGYARKYIFDSRLMTRPPPFYPLTPDIDIIRWRDVAGQVDPS
jgi:hypothetical protein